MYGVAAFGMLCTTCIAHLKRANIRLEKMHGTAKGSKDWSTLDMKKTKVLGSFLDDKKD